MASNSYVPIRVLEPVSILVLTRVHHSCGVLISDRCLSGHHLLVLDELLVARVASNMLQPIRVGAVVTMNLLRIVLCTDSNHSSVLISGVLLTILSCSSDEDNIALRNSSLVGTRV